MKSVYKYIMTGKSTVFDLPAGSEALSVGYQEGESVIWFLVDIEESVVDVVSRTFTAFATGERIEGDDFKHLMYVGTATTDVGNVWHIFEELGMPS
jgi:hypothetical protein